MDGAQNTVNMQAPWLVHDTSKAIRLTHWLACNSLGCSWHAQAHLYATNHRTLAISSPPHKVSGASTLGPVPEQVIHLVLGFTFNFYRLWGSS